MRSPNLAPFLHIHLLLAGRPLFRNADVTRGSLSPLGIKCPLYTSLDNLAGKMFNFASGIRILRLDLAHFLKHFPCQGRTEPGRAINKKYLTFFSINLLTAQAVGSNV